MPLVLVWGNRGYPPPTTTRQMCSLKERDVRKEKTKPEAEGMHKRGGEIKHGNEGKETRGFWKSQLCPFPQHKTTTAASDTTIFPQNF